MGCHALLHRIFSIQGSKLRCLHLLHCKWILSTEPPGKKPSSAPLEDPKYTGERNMKIQSYNSDKEIICKVTRPKWLVIIHLPSFQMVDSSYLYQKIYIYIYIFIYIYIYIFLYIYIFIYILYIYLYQKIYIYIYIYIFGQEQTEP